MELECSQIEVSAGASSRGVRRCVAGLRENQLMPWQRNDCRAAMKYFGGSLLGRVVHKHT